MSSGRKKSRAAKITSIPSRLKSSIAEIMNMIMNAHAPHSSTDLDTVNISWKSKMIGAGGMSSTAQELLKTVSALTAGDLLK